MKIGNAIKQVRKNKGISQGELASSCKISQTYLSQIESDIKIPRPKTLQKICTVMGTPEVLIYMLATEISDVPVKKQEAYKILFPTVKDLIFQIIA